MQELKHADTQTLKYICIENYFQLKNLQTVQLIDLRSEKEFAQGHIPQAINIPLLNNQERHLVGYTYKQKSKYEAIDTGLEIFSKKCSNFCELFLRLKKTLNKDKTTLAIYCWRGGMRSKLTGLLLQALGFNILIIKDGYKKFRSFVNEIVTEKIPKHDLIVLNGNTGSGKTYLLKKLKTLKFAAIDFEGLAKHRGSAFGDFGQKEKSPTQEHFDNLLAYEYFTQKNHKIIFVELENAIGPIKIHPFIHKKLLKSPMLFVERDFHDRVAHIEKDYAFPWNQNLYSIFEKRLELLQKKLSKEQIYRLKKDSQNHELKKTIANLLLWHYDLRYEKSLKRHKKQMLAHFNITNHEQKAIAFITKIAKS